MVIWLYETFPSPGESIANWVDVEAILRALCLESPKAPSLAKLQKYMFSNPKVRELHRNFILFTHIVTTIVRLWWQYVPVLMNFLNFMNLKYFAFNWKFHPWFPLLWNYGYHSSEMFVRHLNLVKLLWREKSLRIRIWFNLLFRRRVTWRTF